MLHLHFTQLINEVDYSTNNSQTYIYNKKVNNNSKEKKMTEIPEYNNQQKNLVEINEMQG